MHRHNVGRLQDAEESRSTLRSLEIFDSKLITLQSQADDGAGTLGGNMADMPEGFAGGSIGNVHFNHGTFNCCNCIAERDRGMRVTARV